MGFNWASRLGWTVGVVAQSGFSWGSRLGWSGGGLDAEQVQLWLQIGLD